MKVLITGAGGQLGQSLLKTATAEHQIRAFVRTELSIADVKAVFRATKEFRPDLIVNAAAYTAVDKAETERELAFAINSCGADNLGRAAQECGARLIHISTDFVFDGKKSSPYRPADEMKPLGVYGASKAEGENRLRALMDDKMIIIRTGWVYAVEGHNFVKTVLRLMTAEDALSVIADQVGTPTWAISLANMVWKVAQNPEIKGTHHWSDAGVASWYDLAVAVQEEALTQGKLKKAIPIRPISTDEYPLPAMRPAYSVLDKGSAIREIGMVPLHWRVNLRNMLREYRNA